VKKRVPIAALLGGFLACLSVYAQSAPNVSQVLMWSTVLDTRVGGERTNAQPAGTGVLPRALFSIYTVSDPGGFTSGNFAAINTPSNYRISNVSALNSAISSSVGLALALIPVASPASSVIEKTDPVTGIPSGANGTLGPVFTERAETIGKGKFFIGFSHQNYHFTEINGRKLNGLSVLYEGSDSTPLATTGGKTRPATINMAADIRLSQELAFLTYGITDRIDVSVGLPMVHSAVAATAYNGQIYAGAGLAGLDGNPGNCWCENTLAPATFRLTQAFIGQSSRSKTGFGDILLRAKGIVFSRSNAIVSVGTDLRFPSGDADNYLGTGTTTAKPFVAVSLYKKYASGFVFSPHVNVGWQFSGKSILGGQMEGSVQTATMSNGEKVSYLGAPFTVVKDTLPDVFAWAAGTELAIGRRNTVVADILGNHIGWINGAQLVVQGSAQGNAPFAPYSSTTVNGLAGGSKGSFAQYSGSFGYKVRISGNLVATVNALVRLNDAGLTARVVPLYGLSYTF
jgi:hypothetical protein